MAALLVHCVAEGARHGLTVLPAFTVAGVERIREGLLQPAGPGTISGCRGEK